MNFPLHQNPEESESEALARAVALSENELIQQREHDDRASERLARAYHNEELSRAETELLASAVQSSQEQHAIDNKRRRLNHVLNEQHCQVSSDRHVGSWECARCTYRNAPYAGTCGACRVAAPPQVLTYTGIAPLRFGLEIELIVPNGKRDGFTLANLAREWNASVALSSSSSSSPIPRVQFLQYTDKDTITDWKIVPDTSLEGDSPHDLCLELVSPILQGEGGLRQLRAVMERLRSLGITTNSSCGFHVHVDAERGNEQALPAMSTLAGIQRIARSFLALENAFDLLVGLSWDDDTDHARRANHNRFCQSNRIGGVLGECSNRQRWNRITETRNFTALVQLVCLDRYRKLNLTNIIHRDRPSTCEFRHHGGVEDLQEAEAWVRLLLRFCERVSDPVTNDAAFCLLTQGSAPKEEVRALFRLLDCPGLEQYFGVERRLFLDERLANPWKCGVCHRVFQTSRSLSQHAAATNHYTRLASDKFK